MGLTELTTSVYNRIAESLGWPKTATPQEMTEKVADYLGVKRPSTTAERVTEAVAGSAAGGFGPAKGAEALGKLLPGTAGRVATEMGTRPITQAVSGAAGGVAGQTAAEAGYGPLTQYAASLLGSGVPLAPGSVAAVPRKMAKEALDAGYVLPPTEFSEHPGLVSQVMSGSGKIRMEQAASVKNQKITNQLAAQDLGLPKDTTLSPQVFADVRKQAGNQYKAVQNAVPLIGSDAEYINDLAKIGNRQSPAAQLFPNIVGNKGVEKLVKKLTSVNQMSTEAAMDLVKSLRYKANANLRNRDNPKKLDLGLAQRDAAEAIDELMDRNITATGQTDVIANYRKARQLIAKSYDVEAAYNPANGDVRGQRLAVLAGRGRPLTGGLDTIAKVAGSFPKATQQPATFGYGQDWSALDLFAGLAAVMAGHPEAAGVVVARPGMRAATLSRPYQAAMTGTPQPRVPLPLLLNPGAQGIVMPDQMPGLMEAGR